MLKKKRGTPKNTIIPRKRRQTSKPKSVIHASPPVTIKTPFVINRSVPMRILMVLDQLNIGGTETYTLSVTRELIKKGVFVVIACKKGKLREHFLGLGCPVYEIDFVLDNYELDYQNRIKNLELLKSVISSEQIDLVHCHQVPSGSLALLAAKQMHIPCVFTVHGTYYDMDILESLQRGSTITCVSPSIKRLLLSKGIDTKVISNGIDNHEYHKYGPAYLQHFRTKLGLSRDAIVVLYAGRLSWEKGEICEEIIHTVDSLRKNGYSHLHLIIAGGGNKQQDILELIDKKHHLINEHFIHYVGEITNMGVYYSISDCVIGTGRVALEAMSCERPVIAVGTKGFLGIVNPDKYEKAWDSWFGDHDDDNKCSRAMLTSHLRELITMEANAKSHLVHSGKQFVTQRFPISQTAESLMSIYLRSIIEDNYNYIAQQ
ncbi:glycosyltransferase [Paenibacillus terrigena]|uniref:glycosyltransferase n=1 Tax=Paenibacillus terrigena TaxID=369333 RepID=UPI0028D30387|nr:glycosyltransferase [Paenibacillus terrigena]